MGSGSSIVFPVQPREARSDAGVGGFIRGVRYDNSGITNNVSERGLVDKTAVSRCIPRLWVVQSNPEPTAAAAINSSKIISSWIKILSLSEESLEGAPNVSGIIIFQRTFFEFLKEEDPHDCILHLLGKCSASALKSRRTPESMLFIIVRFLVSVTEKSPENVRKLRSLGRYHQRRKILREHVITFKTVLYKTVTRLLQLSPTAPLLRDWTTLTEFVFSEMYKYDYIFSPRRSFSDVNDETDVVNESLTLNNNSSTVELVHSSSSCSRFPGAEASHNSCNLIMLSTDDDDDEHDRRSNVFPFEVGSTSAAAGGGGGFINESECLDCHHAKSSVPPSNDDNGLVGSNYYQQHQQVARKSKERQIIEDMFAQEFMVDGIQSEI